MSTHKFGFWLIIEGEVGDKIQKETDRYAALTGTESFKPHIAIAGHVIGEESEVINKAEKWVSKLQPLTLSTGAIDFANTQHQCIFVRVPATKELMQAHLAGVYLFGSEQKLYMPHISLLYHPSMDMGERERIAKKIDFPPQQFSISTIEFFREDGPKPRDWKVVKKFSIEK